MKHFPTDRRSLARLALLLLLLVASVYAIFLRGPCFTLFPHLDRPYDFTLKVGSRSYSGNSSSTTDYLVLYLAKLLPGGVDFKVDFYGVLYEGNSYNYIDNTILMDGAYEKPILYFLRDVMVRLGSGQGFFMDVGANTGQHSLFMARYAKQVHAFEPYEPVLRRFRRMKDLNGIDQIIIHPVGLGDENAAFPFFAPPDENLGTGSFVKDFSEVNKPSEQLRVVRGDEWLEGFGSPRFQLIKMDIEGYERAALRGLEKTLRDSRPVVVLETTLGSSEGFQNTEELLSAFPSNYGYLEILRFGPDWCRGIYKLVAFDGGEGRQAYVVLFPEELRDTIPTSPASGENGTDQGRAALAFGLEAETRVRWPQHEPDSRFH